MRKIIHIDMDAFYASVEQRDNPALKGMPVAVGHAEKRGVVAAASYEARKFGVHSALASVTAIRKCPHLVFVPPRFEVYRSVSNQIRAIFADYTSLVEPLSLDEAYLDVTENLRGIATARATAGEIRARILETTGLTASAGISYNKFFAKLASDHRKPDGQFVILPDHGTQFIDRLPVEKFHGIGPKTAQRMRGLGIHTGQELRAQSLEFLQRHFGKIGEWYFQISRGEDPRPVQADRVRKSSGSETTFSEDLTDFAALETAAVSMAKEVWAWCAAHTAYGRTVTLKIKFGDFKQITRSMSLPTPLLSGTALESTSVSLLKTVFPLRRRVRLVGVSVSNFEPRKVESLPQLGFEFSLSERG